MTSDPVVLTPDTSIAEALARVRDPDLTPALASSRARPRPRPLGTTWVVCICSGCFVTRRPSWSAELWTLTCSRSLRRPRWPR